MTAGDKKTIIYSALLLLEESLDISVETIKVMYKKKPDVKLKSELDEAEKLLIDTRKIIKEMEDKKDITL